MKTMFHSIPLKKAIRTMILVTGCFAIATSASAATVASGYSFSSPPVSGTYPAITGGLVQGNNANDNQQFFPNIGFTFSFRGLPFTKVGISSNGYVWFANDPTLSHPSETVSLPLSTATGGTMPNTVLGIIAAFGGDLKSKSNGNIRIQTMPISGDPVNRVCIIQWSHYQKASINDDLNFQIRISESSNSISVIYGTMIIGASSNVEVGLRGASRLDVNNRIVALNTNWTSSTAGNSNATIANYASGRIPYNLKYNWTNANSDLAVKHTGINDTTPVNKTLSGGSQQRLITSDLFKANLLLAVPTLKYKINGNLQPSIVMSYDYSSGDYSHFHALLPAVYAQDAVVDYFENYTTTGGFNVNSNIIAFEIGSLHVIGPGNLTVPNSTLSTGLSLRAASPHSGLKFTEVTLNRFGQGATQNYPSYLGSADKDLVQIANLSTTALDISGFSLVFESGVLSNSSIPAYLSSSTTDQRTFTIPDNQPLVQPNAPVIINIGYADYNAPDNATQHFYNMGGTPNSLSLNDPCGFILKNQYGDVIDAVAFNGFLFDGSQGENDADWFGRPGTSCTNRAGFIRTNATDHNTAADWVESTATLKQKIGLPELLLANAFPGPVITWQSTQLGNYTGEKIFIPGSAFSGPGTYHFNITAIDGQASASTDADITVEFDDGRIMLNAQSGNSVAAIVRAYPNPVTDNVEIKFNAEQEQNCLVKLMDVTGRQIAEHTITVTKGSNEFQLDLKFLAPGIYAMQLMIDGKTESVRLIKN